MDGIGRLTWTKKGAAVAALFVLDKDATSRNFVHLHDKPSADEAKEEMGVGGEHESLSQGGPIRV